ncbi:CU044_5270 family protein [Cellulomonas fimi]|uniref:CU044_5270 family protein n=1 Tax=Cellulomonas fimi TaxID=1708 RepID=UPI00234C56CA|nr:CU044_5270 family protein [Cellulomonas fimi]MDC7122676.1 CU044_5270 family protein [Cellulomonas fimi]
MDLSTLLAETAPRPSVLSDEALARAAARVDAEVRTASQRVHVIRRAKRRRRVAAASFVSVAAAAALVIAPTVDLGGGRLESAEAAAVLVSAAAAAGDQAGGWPDAAYWHVVSTQEYDGVTYPRQMWRGRIADSAIQDTFAFDVGPELSGADGVYTVGVGPAIFAYVDWAGLYALPTDPTELEHALRNMGEGHGPDPDSQLWSDIGELQRETPAPPALRAVLWTVASRIPGVVLVGDVTDSTGRPGVAVERDMTEDGWSRERYIIDRATGDLLEEVSFDSDDTVVYRMTVLSQGPADSAPPADPPVCGPGSVPERSC